MADKTPVPLNKIRDVARTFINDNYPEEVSFFNHLWEAFESRAREWINHLPDKWPLIDTFREATSEFNLVDERSMDLVTPRFLAMLLATLFDVSTDSPGNQAEKVGVALKRYANRFRVPMDVVSRSEPMVRMLLRKDYESLGLYPETEPVETIALLRSDQKPLEGTEEEVAVELKKARDEKESFDIYLDDLRNEFHVNGIKKDLTMEPKLLLIILLQRVGVYQPYSNLCQRIWGDYRKPSDQLFNLLNRLHKTTENLLKPYINLPRGQERCYVSEKINQSVSYCIIYLAGDYPYDGLSLPTMNPPR